MKALSRRRNVSRRVWWTRERVLAGLRRFYREHHAAPTNCDEWAALTMSHTLPPRRPYPCHATIFRYFPTLRQAWAAAGIRTDRQHEDFTPEEHWYLREAAGLVSRKEMARDLRRTPQAVKTYLHQYGLHSYQMQGWSLTHAAEQTGISVYWLRRFIAAGQLTAVQGSKCIFVRPEEVRRMVLGELVGVLSKRVDRGEGRCYDPIV